MASNSLIPQLVPQVAQEDTGPPQYVRPQYPYIPPTSVQGTPALGYTYKGHSSDMCDVMTGKPKVVKVPDGSVIIQDGECGFSTQAPYGDVDTRNQVMITNTQEMTDISNPQKLLADYRRLTGKQSASIHTPGDSHGFVKSLMILLSDWITERNGKVILDIRISGIYEFGSSNQPPVGFNFGNKHVQDLSITPEISKTVISNMFAYSIYPTQNYVNYQLERITSDEYLTLDQYKQFRANPLFELDFIDFVGKHPGVHFHHSCRNTSGCGSLQLKLRRANSMIFKNDEVDLPFDLKFNSSEAVMEVADVPFYANLYGPYVNRLPIEDVTRDRLKRSFSGVVKLFTPNFFTQYLNELNKLIEDKPKLYKLIEDVILPEFSDYLIEQNAPRSVRAEYAFMYAQWTMYKPQKTSLNATQVFDKFFSKGFEKIDRKNRSTKLNAKRVESLLNPPALGRLGGKKTRRKRRRSFRRKTHKNNS